jgi:hypothetical protein
MPPVRGSCLCGGIKFEIMGPMFGAMNCHCSQCRKQHGAAFRSRVRVAASDFRWIAGEELLKFWESPRGYQRGFCRECGSPVINRAGPNWKPPAEFPVTTPQYGIPLALLEDPPARGPSCTVSSPARRRGSRSPTTCRNTRNTRRRAKTRNDRQRKVFAKSSRYDAEQINTCRRAN